MSRVMGLASGARPAAGFALLVAPVGLVRLDEVGGEDFAGGEVDDGDVVVVGEGEDACAGEIRRWW
jgi:hypothetical protein